MRRKFGIRNQINDINRRRSEVISWSKQVNERCIPMRQLQKKQSAVVILSRKRNMRRPRSVKAMKKCLLHCIGSVNKKIAHSKLNSMLELLESLGVEEASQFRKRSSRVLRELLLSIANQIKEDLLTKIKASPFFGILTDEVTDITNIQYLVTFIKYFDNQTGEARTSFIDSSDILQFSKTNSADSETIHDCLVDLISKLGLELKNLKAFSSDGASVMTGGNTGVAARLRQHQVLKCMLNVHCICHRLALACADSSDQLTFLKEFETTLIQLWAFFKNSPKRLNIYTKTALKMLFM